MSSIPNALFSPSIISTNDAFPANSFISSSASRAISCGRIAPDTIFCWRRFPIFEIVRWRTPGFFVNVPNNTRNAFDGWLSHSAICSGVIPKSSGVISFTISCASFANCPFKKRSGRRGKPAPPASAPAPAPVAASDPAVAPSPSDEKNRENFFIISSISTDSHFSFISFIISSIHAGFASVPSSTPISIIQQIERMRKCSQTARFVPSDTADHTPSETTTPGKIVPGFPR